MQDRRVATAISATLLSYLPTDRRHALATGQELPDRAQGAALFADISGFTPLTEALTTALGPRRGAEELTLQINRVYDALIVEVDRYGGSVIGFAGDAITCWFADGPTSAAPRAVACALAMQRAMGQFAAMPVVGGGMISLAVKIAVAAGAARRFVVGDPTIQLLDVLAGATLDRLAAAERHAATREIVLDGETARALGETLHVVEWRDVQQAASGAAANGFAVIDGISGIVAALPWPPLEPQALGEDELRPWLLQAVYRRLRRGQSSFIAELRPAVALFLRFSGIDYDDDPAAGACLDAFVRWVQQVVARYDGTLLQITMGDKGSYLYCAFGAPVAHEDDVLRALNAARDLLAPPPELGFIRAIQIGVSRGQMRAGDYGGGERRTYGVLGNEVNVAARLMAAAPAGHILTTSAVVEAAGADFEVHELAPVMLRGLARPLRVFDVRDRQRQPGGRTARTHTTIVGRDEERAALSGLLAGLRAGNSASVIIEGDAGIGKSRLVAHLVQEAQGAAMRCLIGAGDAIERTALYHAWRPIFAQLFDLDLQVDQLTLAARDAWREQALEYLEATLPERLDLAPLLNAVLPIDLPDNGLTRFMTGEVRANNTQELLIALLDAAAAEAPLVLVIEDAHWLDSASWALLRLASRDVRPALLAVATRPLPAPPPPEYSQLRAAVETLHLNVQALPPASIRQLVAQRLGVDALPSSVADFIQAKAEGHPFFSEELAYALRDAGLIQVDGRACRVAPGSPNLATLSFPDTIQGVITSRIDRLAPEHQLTVKVASIVGRLFAYRVLHDIHPIEPEKAYLREHLEVLHRLDITPLETPEPELAYIFKHVITQEVTYNLMTFSQRRELHRVVAQWYERTFGADLQPYYTLLAYHWRLAIGDPRTDGELVEKAIGYLELAGQQALHGNANQEAVYSFGEALALDAQRDTGANRLRRARLHRQRGEACYRLGQTDRSRQDLERALQILGRPIPDAPGRVAASLLREAGRQALHRLRPARMLGRATGEQAELAHEVATAHALLIPIYYVAEETNGFMHSTICALNLAETIPPTVVLAEGYATLCIIMGVIGRYAWAEAYARMAMEAAERIDTPSVRGTTLTRISVYWASIGQWEQARAASEQAIRHYARINNYRDWGDSRNILSLQLCFHGQYAESLQLCDEIGALGRKHENIQHAAWGRGGAARNLLKMGRFAETIASANETIALHGESIMDTEKFAPSASLALATFRTGRYGEALALADQILDWLERRAPSLFATQDIYVDLAELYLSAWELSASGQLAEEGRPVRPARPLAASAQRACKALHKFAKVFPIGRPAAWLSQGRYEHMAGKPAQAVATWRKGLELATQLDMPYELGRIHYELGRRAASGDQARAEHLRTAAAIFERLEARYDRDLAHAALGLAR